MEEEIMRMLKSNKEVTMLGLVKLSIVRRKERSVNATIPREKGEPVKKKTIPAHNAVKAKPLKKLKDSIL